MKAIKITNLTKSYGKSRGIKNINLEIKEGEIWFYRAKWSRKVNDNKNFA